MCVNVDVNNDAAAQKVGMSPVEGVLLAHESSDMRTNKNKGNGGLTSRRDVVAPIAGQ